MSRTALLFAAACALAACSLRAPRVSGSSPCASNRECDPSNVCYLGECRGGASALRQVAAEVRPPNDAQLSLLQRGGIDLRASTVVDFELEPLATVAGVVSQAQDADGGTAPVASALVTFTNHTPPIPDRLERITVASDQSGGFSARLAPGAAWDALVQPPAPLPPSRFPSLVLQPTGLVSLELPRVGALSRVTGTLSAGSAPLDGARVEALDATGQPVAAPALAADGGFELLLPPQAPPYELQVGPGAGADGGASPAPALDPLPNFAPIAPTFTAAGTIAQSYGALPPAAPLQGVVVDASGAPVAGARVYTTSLDPLGYTLARSATADASGAFSLTLRQGSYAVEAAPDASPSTPGVSSEQVVLVSASTPPLRIVCPRKSAALGFVQRPDGSPAGAGYQITATRLPDRLITSRTEFSTATDSAGLFHVIGDAGLYRIEIAPPAGTELPRKIVQVDLGGSGAEVALPVIRLSPPLEVLGTVRGHPPGGLDAPVAGAVVDFFALDAAGAHAIYLGSGVTDSSGHYRAVLPDVPQPGLMP